LGSYSVLDVVFVEDVDVKVDWQYNINVPKVGDGRFLLSESKRQESNGDRCKVEVEGYVDVKLGSCRRRRRWGAVYRRLRRSSSQMSGAQ
jgi:hypothetical protein